MSLYQEVADRFLAAPKKSTPQPALTDLLVATSKAIDLLERRPMRHGLKIAVIAGSIAKVMGLAQREIASIVYASLLHDVGLARVVSELAPRLPDGMREKEVFYSHTLLNSRVVTVSPEMALSETARNILSNHPIASASFIDSVHLSHDVQDIVSAHHELCDGSGYPLGLRREAIPIGARILAFADTVEAVMQEVAGLTTRKQAVESFIEVKAHPRFDPDVVAAFAPMAAQEDFLRQLYTLEVDKMLDPLLPERAFPLTGKALLDIVRAMSQLPDNLLPYYTQHHSEKVANYAARMAECIGIQREQMGELVLAALLHDMGKLAIPYNVFMKQGPLGQQDWAIIHDHSRYTGEVLKGIPGFTNVGTWAAEHHERMNGSGYHCQRKGFELSVAGRILGICDVFDALTSPRPYRTHAYEPLDALPVLGQGRYRLYDNQLVNVIRSVILNTEILVS